MSELDGATTSVGGILASMIYQIEKTNQKVKQTEGALIPEVDKEEEILEKPTHRSALNVVVTTEDE